MSSATPHSAPPDTLDQDLEVAVEDWSNRDFYYLVTGLVIPRPIGWISTISAKAVRNLAPYSFFNVLGSKPFYVAFGSQTVKDTVRNLREVPEFVCNIPHMALMDQVEFTGADFPHGEEEFAWANLTPAPSRRVRPPRVAEARAHLECELTQIIVDGTLNIVLGKIIHAHVVPEVWQHGRVNPRLLDPLGRLSGTGYASLGDVYTVKRAAWKDLSSVPRDSVEMPRAVHVSGTGDIPKRQD